MTIETLTQILDMLDGRGMVITDYDLLYEAMDELLDYHDDVVKIR